tara:strand:- start:367 stop:1104 length:738 start_codon:yes stop_codon:yes gene_type:complete
MSIEEINMRSLLIVLSLVGGLYWYFSPNTATDPSTDISFSYITEVVGNEGEANASPLLIALHGNGDTASHFFDTMLHDYPGSARVVVISGPVAMGTGDAWPTNDEGLRHYGSALAGAIHKITQKYDHPKEPVLTGFSGGGYMAYYLAAKHGYQFSAIVPVSGGLPQAIEADTTDSELKVVSLHGTKDRVVSYGQGKAATDHLKKAGYSIEHYAFDGDHLGAFRDEVHSNYHQVLHNLSNSRTVKF